MKRIAAVLLASLSLWSAADARPRGIFGSPPFNVGNSQLGPQFMGVNGEYHTLNALKEGTRLQYGDLSNFPTPNEVDGNGYPLFGANMFSHGGLTTTMSTPSQALRPGHYVVTATGGGAITLAIGGGATLTSSACTGTATGNSCDNSACTAFTGSIAPSGSHGLLTVTVAPTGTGCSLVVGQPISNGSTFSNQFGVPTIITGKSGSSNCPSCTGTGGTGTYLVNWSQTVGSGSINPGLRSEIAVTANTENTTTSSTWRATITSVASGNTFGNAGVVFVGDESLYAAGQLTHPLFKSRVTQGNFGYLRDLNLANTNGTNVTTWATRKPAAYISYNTSELRNSIYAGVAAYALNGSSNDYSVNLGAALPVDKQTVCVQDANTASSSAIVTFSIDGGTHKFPVLEFHANAMPPSFPRVNDQTAYTFDAFNSTWISTVDGGNVSCLNNFMPPEAFVQMNIELGTTEDVVEPYLGSDPITDYPTQYAKYIAANHPPSSPVFLPVFETPDETWNCSGSGALGTYASWLSVGYIAVDTTWNTNKSGHAFCGGATGDLNNETGKMGSLLAQAIRAVSPTYFVAVGVQSAQLAAAAWNANILSNSYVGQSPTNIPIQSGCAGAGAVQTSCPAPFTQTAAYRAGATDVSISNYWVVGDQSTAAGLQAEVALGYCYFFQSGSCASQASLMTTYMGTYNAGCSACVTGGGAAQDARALAWYNFANTCAGGASCTPMSVRFYEGDYTPAVVSSDRTASATAATNAASAVLAVNPNGCVAGQTVALSALVGGTWSTAAGSYTVQATGTDSTHCAINLNSTGLGTLSSATLTYTGSAAYTTYLRRMSFLSPDIQTVHTLLLNVISSITASSACFPAACGKAPSLFNLSTNDPLLLNQSGSAFAFDLYGYFPTASCTSCTIATTNLTLGGTITGIFTSGLTILGKGFTTLAITGACSQTGAGPAGSNAGDVCPLSGSATVSSGETITGNATPGTTRNPVTWWQSWCDWNNNSSACNIN